MNKEQAEKHHAFCVEEFKRHKEGLSLDWRCCCDLLRRYDKWLLSLVGGRDA